jgi:hypothetical protein
VVAATVTTIDRRVRTERYIEFWVPAGASAKDMGEVIIQAAREWWDVSDMLPAGDGYHYPPYDDWYTIHPHDEHVIIRIKCPDETS